MALGSSPVQTVPAYERSTGMTVSISAPSAGNCLIALIALSDGAVSVSSVTGGGVTWALAQRRVESADRCATEIWVGLDSSGSGTSIVVTLSSKDYHSVTILEWAGVAAASALDNTGSTQGSDVSEPFTVPSGSVATSNADDLIIFVGCHRSTVYATGPTDSFTLIGPNELGSTAHHAGGYRVVGATGTYNSTYTVDASVFYASVIIALKAAGGATGPANLGTWCDLVKASIGTIDDLAIGSVGSVDDLT